MSTKPGQLQLLARLDLYQGRLKDIRETAPIARALTKDASGLNEAFDKVAARGQTLIGRAVPPETLSAALVTIRNAAAAKIFSGSVQVAALTTPDRQRLRSIRERMEQAVGGETVAAYGLLAVGDTADRLRQEYKFLDIGIHLLDTDPEICPFCQQTLAAQSTTEIQRRHAHLTEAIAARPDHDSLRTDLATRLKNLARLRARTLV